MDAGMEGRKAAFLRESHSPVSNVLGIANVTSAGLLLAIHAIAAGKLPIVWGAALALVPRRGYQWQSVIRMLVGN
jgi:hypothetical protein